MTCLAYLARHNIGLVLTKDECHKRVSEEIEYLYN